MFDIHLSAMFMRIFDWYQILSIEFTDNTLGLRDAKNKSGGSKLIG